MPMIPKPSPSSQSGLWRRRASSDGRSARVAGARRASIAWSTMPTLNRAEATSAAMRPTASTGLCFLTTGRYVWRRAMRGAFVLTALAAGLWLAAPGVAKAAPCGLPDAAPVWFDFADGTVPFRNVFAKPGLIVATTGGPILTSFRNAGAQTVYWEMHFENDVGTPGAPAPSDSIGSAADTPFNRASSS